MNIYMEIYHVVFLCYCILISNVIHSYMLYRTDVRVVKLVNWLYYLLDNVEVQDPPQRRIELSSQ